MLTAAEISEMRGETRRAMPDSMEVGTKVVGAGQPGGTDETYEWGDPADCLMKPLDGRLVEQLGLEDVREGLIATYDPSIEITTANRVRYGGRIFQVVYVEPARDFQITGKAALSLARQNA